MNCSICNIPGVPHEIIDGKCHRCAIIRIKDLEIQLATIDELINPKITTRVIFPDEPGWSNTYQGVLNKLRQLWIMDNTPKET